MRTIIGAPRMLPRGFTLLELMVTLTVVAILGIIAVPNFHTFMLNERRDSVVDALTASLQYARNQALNLNEKTTLCAGQPGISCTGGAWSNGWQVVQVPAGATTVALTSHVIQVASTAPTIRAVNTSTAMTFGGNGLVTFNPTTVTDEFIQVCDSRGSTYARAVEVNSAGYIQSSSKVGFTPSNVAITCP
jgi:type IV fimbrial biogenesis protein FimT